jgi:hypothetical protein
MLQKSQGSSVSVETRLQVGQPRFNSQQRKWWVFLFTSASRLALGPRQPPTQWVLGNLTPGVKCQGMELTIHFHLVLRLMHGAITPLPLYNFMIWCLVKHRDNFIFTFTYYKCFVIKDTSVRYEIFMVVKTEFMVFWSVCCLLKIGVSWCSEILVSKHHTTWHNNPEKNKF